MNLNGMLKIIPEHPYYPNNKYCEELGLVEFDKVETDNISKHWNRQTIIWMLALALLMWMISYLMILTITMCFDVSFRSVAGVSGVIHWFNGTTALIAEDHVRIFRML
ncbi:unnamed protein product [Arctia plantaginis]|uniref:Uncharacterized protein n=1 Tax=Arctia plantaginis TaxID=874455 RepID=A0A8S0ZQ26_ARCPL|nr:unnamed protein product [Arctia plantaginis]